MCACRNSSGFTTHSGILFFGGFSCLQVSCSADNKEEKEESLLKELTLMVGLDHSNVVHFIGATHELMNFNIFMEWTAGRKMHTV